MFAEGGGDQLAALHAVAQVCAESETVEQAFGHLLPAICAGIGWDVGAAWSLDESAGLLRCIGFWANRDTMAFEAVTRATAFAPGVGLPGRVWSSGVACRIVDVVTDPNFPRAPAAERDGLHGAFAFPIRIRAEVLGVLEFFSSSARGTSAELLRTLDTIGGQIGMFIQRTRAQEAVRASREQLQALSRRLVMTQEAERRHLAHELHDELGQVLAGLKLLLEASTRLPHDRALARIHEARVLVDELARKVQALSLDLRPAILDDGLVRALEACFDRTPAECAVHFEHASIDGHRFPHELEITVYRVVQEALTNVIRHANAREVTVRLTSDATRIRIEIDDDGVGFDPAAISRPGGLSGMMERATLLGGRFAIESRGRGTCVVAELPLGGPGAKPA